MNEERGYQETANEQSSPRECERLDIVPVTEIEFEGRRWDSYSGRLEGDALWKGASWRIGVAWCQVCVDCNPSLPPLSNNLSQPHVLFSLCCVSLHLTRGSEGVSGAGWSLLGYE